MGQQTSRQKCESGDLSKEIRICTSGNEGNCCFASPQQREVFRPSRTQNTMPSSISYAESSRPIRIPLCLCKRSCPCHTDKVVPEEQQAFNRLRDSFKSSMEIGLCSGPMKKDTYKANNVISPNKQPSHIYRRETTFVGSTEIKRSTSNEIKVCPSDTLRPSTLSTYEKHGTNLASRDFKTMPFRRRNCEFCQKSYISPRLSTFSSVSAHPTSRSTYDGQSTEIFNANKFPSNIKGTSQIQVRPGQSRQSSMEDSQNPNQYRKSNIGVLYDRRRDSERNARENGWRRSSYETRDSLSASLYDQQRQALRESSRVSYSNDHSPYEARRNSIYELQGSRDYYGSENYGAIDRDARSVTHYDHQKQAPQPGARVSYSNDYSTQNSKGKYAYDSDLVRNTYAMQHYGALDRRSTIRKIVQSASPAVATQNQAPRRSPSTSTYLRMPVRKGSSLARQVVGNRASTTKSSARACIDCCAQTSGVFNEHDCNDVRTQTSQLDCANVRTQTSNMRSDMDCANVRTQTLAKLADCDCMDAKIQTSARLLTPSCIEVRTQTSKLPKTNRFGTVTNAECAGIKTQTSRFSRKSTKNAPTQPMTSFAQQSYNDARTQTSSKRFTDVCVTTSIQSLQNQVGSEVRIRPKEMSMPTMRDNKRQRQARGKELGVIYDRHRDSGRENYKNVYAKRNSQRRISEARDSRTSTANDYASIFGARESSGCGGCSPWLSKRNVTRDSSYTAHPNKRQKQEKRDFRRESYEKEYYGASGRERNSKIGSCLAICARCERERDEEQARDCKRENYDADNYGHAYERYSDMSHCRRTESPTNGNGQAAENIAANSAGVSETISAAINIEKEDDSSSDEEQHEKPNLMLLQPVVVCYQAPQQPCCSYPYNTSTCCDYSCYSYGCDPCCQNACQPLNMPYCTPQPNINNCFSIDPGYCFSNSCNGNYHKKKHKKKSRHNRTSQ